MGDNNYWIINGEAYDLSKFKHPAGPIALECGKGRDCTGLFLSYHPFTDKPQQILKKYKVKKPENAEEQNEFDFTKKSQFFEELNKEVQEKVFKNKTHYATFERWVQIAIMGIVAATLCPFYFMGHYWASIAFPLALWVFVANTFHDATHFALSPNWKINWLFSYTAPVYTSPFTWYHQHVIGHHIYTNIHKKDPDMHHGTYLWRFNPKSRWYKWYKYEFYYLWFIWCNMAMSMAFLIDTFFMIRGSYHRVVKSMKISKRRKYLHFAGRILTFIAVYVWPFFHPSFSWFKAFYFATIPYYILGFCFALASQFNHLTEKNFEKTSRDWYEHQVLTSHTWGADSLFWFIFTGGLNLQTEHHLFPGVNHWHLREIQPIVEKYCNKFGIQYRSSKTVFEAFRKHVDHLQKLMVDDKEKTN